jgi:hypothetical protein
LRLEAMTHDAGKDARRALFYALLTGPKARIRSEERGRVEAPRRPLEER